MQLTASICICTYNGATRIGSVLEALGRQTFNEGEWEVLVIDNASTDGTGEVAARFIKEMLGGRGRVVREDKAGLSFARSRVAREARGEIVCFLDDDNIPAASFLASAIHAFAEFPKAGAIGGKVIARWETEPTLLALAVQDFALAICDRGDKAFCYAKYLGPVGAGLCIRREVLRSIYRIEGKVAAVNGRTGNDCCSGEDVAIAALTWRLGWECWYVPTLAIEHQLPARRMQKDYLLRLYNGIGRGQAVVRKIYDWKARTPLIWLIGFKDYCRWLAGEWRGPSSALRRQHPEIAGDLHELGQILKLGRARQALSRSR